MEERALTWRRSSRSGDNGGNCVEVAELRDAIWVRDSKLGDDSPVLALSRAEWLGFIRAITAN